MQHVIEYIRGSKGQRKMIADAYPDVVEESKKFEEGMRRFARVRGVLGSKMTPSEMRSKRPTRYADRMTNTEKVQGWFTDGRVAFMLEGVERRRSEKVTSNPDAGYLDVIGGVVETTQTTFDVDPIPVGYRGRGLDGVDTPCHVLKTDDPRRPFILVNADYWATLMYRYRGSPVTWHYDGTRLSVKRHGEIVAVLVPIESKSPLTWIDGDVATT